LLTDRSFSEIGQVQYNRGEGKMIHLALPPETIQGFLWEKDGPIQSPNQKLVNTESIIDHN
jgi:hypothetical protein